MTVLPANLELERKVISACLRSASDCETAHNALRDSHFTSPVYRSIFATLSERFALGQPTDGTSIKGELLKRNKMRVPQADQVFAELRFEPLDDLNVESACGLLNDLFIARRLRDLSDTIADQAVKGEPSGQIISYAEEALRNLGDFQQTEDQLWTLGKLLDSTPQKHAKIYDATGGNTGIFTPWTGLNELVGGLRPGRMYVLAARPSLGKSTVVVQMAYNAARKGFNVLLFSHEMARDAIWRRIVSAETNIRAWDMEMGELKADEQKTVSDWLDSHRNANLYVSDCSGRTIQSLNSEVRRFSAKVGAPNLVIIDYLQLMKSGLRTKSEYEDVSELSAACRRGCRDFNCAYLVVSQLNRAVEDREGGEPHLSDLRSSGCLTGDTLIPIYGSGEMVKLQALVGEAGFYVPSLNTETLKVEPSLVSKVFFNGYSPVYMLTTRTGQQIRATQNHKFFTANGWTELRDIHVGDRIAIPRAVECGVKISSLSRLQLGFIAQMLGNGCALRRHAAQYTTDEYDVGVYMAKISKALFGRDIEPRISRERNWYQVYLSSTRKHTHNKHSAICGFMTYHGLWDKRSYEKYVPDAVFSCRNKDIAFFLGNLWSTDGHIGKKAHKRPPVVYYCSSSKRLVYGVKDLLMRLGIIGIVRRVSQGTKGRDQYTVSISDKDSIVRFSDTIPLIGEKQNREMRTLLASIASVKGNTNRDTIPVELVGAIGKKYLTARKNPSRGTVLSAAIEKGDEQLRKIACSDVYWDSVTSIEDCGEGLEAVYDISVEQTHNFLADGIIVHNSIEQDANCVIFVHRPGLLNIKRGKGKDQKEYPKAYTELLVKKMREGRTGCVKLELQGAYSRFREIQSEDEIMEAK